MTETGTDLTAPSARITGKRAAKVEAQTMLMHGIGNVLGYWYEQTPTVARDLGLTDDEFAVILMREADRVARLMDFERAWSN
jgi:hypothetical protein